VFLANYSCLYPNDHNTLGWSRHPSGTETSVGQPSSRSTWVRMPNLNAHAERFVLSVKSECLRKITPLSEGHLRHCIREFTRHCHHERNHQGLDGNLIISHQEAGAVDARVGRATQQAVFRISTTGKLPGGQGRRALVFDPIADWRPSCGPNPRMFDSGVAQAPKESAAETSPGRIRR
jgi:hypothetical protein